MTNTRKYLAAVGLGAALAITCAGPSYAGDGIVRGGHHGHDHGHSGFAPSGTTCANIGEGAHANGVAAGSPGVLSGNQIQIPISIPINICGNSIDIIGLFNPAGGGGNGGGGNNGGGNNGGGNNGGGNDGGGNNGGGNNGGGNDGGGNNGGGNNGGGSSGGNS
ncbi:chaplin [Kitasatospora sp. NPDC092286]|uniref:chaplin n=1 Tax=Kitasatospora sp. NPDC092286 TaxID=3364087 RepID=UPI00382113C9